MAAGDVLIDMTGSGTNNAVISSARVLPDSFSADMNANRGVVSKRSSMWQCAIQRTWATSAYSLG
jgi:hypothetical protein